MGSIAGFAQANTAWNITNRMAQQDHKAGHRMQQHRIDPRRSRCRAAPAALTAALDDASASRCAARSSPASGACQGRRRRAGGSWPQLVHPAQQLLDAAAAHRDRSHDRHAEFGDSFARSMSMPRWRAMSIMLSDQEHRAGRHASAPARDGAPARRLVASATQTEGRACVSLASRPSTTSRVISSSGLRARSE